MISNFSCPVQFYWISLFFSKYFAQNCRIKNGTEGTLKISSNVVGNSNDEINFLYKLLLTNTQVSKLRKAFVNGSSANIELSKFQLHKIGQSRRFLGRLLRPLLKATFLLMGNVLKPLAKSF